MIILEKKDSCFQEESDDKIDLTSAISQSVMLAWLKKVWKKGRGNSWLGFDRDTQTETDRQKERKKLDISTAPFAHAQNLDQNGSFLK